MKEERCGTWSVVVFCWTALNFHVVLACALIGLVFGGVPASCTEPYWPRHTIDDSSAGADGIRLGDLSGDGRLDLAVGWEEGGVTRVYLHPGPHAVKRAWPAATVGRTPNVEDAVFVDIDQDGTLDVVSSCEGSTQTIFVHWAPSKSNVLKADAWRREPFPMTKRKTRWMFAAPAQIDGKRGEDLFVASKNPDGTVGILCSPKDTRQLATWNYRSLYRAGWVMSLVPIDVDRDGDQDVIVSDRKGPNAGVLWLENPGPTRDEWLEHRIGANNLEVMFLDVTVLEDDGTVAVIVAIKPNRLCVLTPRASQVREPWSAKWIAFADDNLGHAKAVKVGDIDRDGKLDLVYSCEGAEPPRNGVVWLSGSLTDSRPWQVFPLSGPKGIKFDRLELIDLDGDQDLDVLTCEERHEGHGLGVIWYENRLSALGEP